MGDIFEKTMADAFLGLEMKLKACNSRLYALSLCLEKAWISLSQPSLLFDIYLSFFVIYFYHLFVLKKTFNIT